MFVGLNTANKNPGDLDSWGLLFILTNVKSNK